MKTSLQKRIESILWRGGMMTLAVVIDAVVQSLTSFNIPAQYTVVLGLILGEISKELKSRYDLKKELENY